MTSESEAQRILDALDQVRPAVLRNLAAVIRAPSMPAMTIAFRTLFRASYAATAEAFLAGGFAREFEEYREDLRHAIPVAACREIRRQIEAETLCSGGLRRQFIRLIDLFSQRIDPSILNVSDTVHIAPMQPSEEHCVPFLIALEDELVELALSRSADWKTPTGADTRAKTAAAREERLQRFLMQKRSSGARATVVGVWRSADVDPHDGRRWRKGQIEESSTMACRIEDVLAGRRKFSPRGK